jgi:hypothetical protein
MFPLSIANGRAFAGSANGSSLLKQFVPMDFNVDGRFNTQTDHGTFRL